MQKTDLDLHLGPTAANYKLLISAIIPRPIAFISTQSRDGKSKNLAPFSYTQLVNHDPPLFIVGFAGGIRDGKDTLRNPMETNECVINVLSENFIEAANASCIDAPYGVSGWNLCGLHPAACSTISGSRVREAVFAVECRLLGIQEYESKVVRGKKTGAVATLEGTRFWVREDALSEEQDCIDPEVLRPVGRLGGIAYSRVAEAVELGRPIFAEVKDSAKVQEILARKDGQTLQ